MSEKTIEELEAELEAIKKANLERELAEQKKIADEAKALEIKKEKDKERETMREEILAELGNKTQIPTNTDTKPTPIKTGLTKSTNMKLAGGEKTDLTMLKRTVKSLRAATEGDNMGALPLDLDETEAYRAPEDEMDYYSRVRWLQAGGKKAQLKAARKANRATGVIR